MNWKIFLGLKLRPSRKSWHAGLMIDDFILLEQMPAAAAKEETKTPGALKVDAVCAAYEQVGLPRRAGKSISQSTFAEFWGAEIDGVQGRARPCLKRLIPLVHILLKVVRLRISSVSLLEVLSGALVSAFQMRRRFMSMLSEVYSAQRGRTRSDVVQLSSQLVDELLCCIGLLVVTEVDFKLKPCPWLIASDASSTMEASVVTEVGDKFTAESQRFGLQKGLWNRLMSPAQAYLREKGLEHEVEHELPERDYDMRPLWEEVVVSQEFKHFHCRKRGQKRRHINLAEISAALESEKKLDFDFPDSYYVHLQDSQVRLPV